MISRLISLGLAISLSLTLLFAAPLLADKIQGTGRGILMLVRDFINYDPLVRSVAFN